jgi:Flp pilus assembly protein TadB
MDTEMQTDGHDHRPVEDASTPELVRELVQEGKRLMREETRLMRLEMKALLTEGQQRLERDVASAKEEIKGEAKKAAKAGGTVAAGGILAHAALYLVLFTVVFALSLAMPLWAACLIVAVAAGAGGAVLIYLGAKDFKRVQLAPRRTLHQLQEDQRWMKDKAYALKSTIRVNT